MHQIRFIMLTRQNTEKALNKENTPSNIIIYLCDVEDRRPRVVSGISVNRRRSCSSGDITELRRHVRTASYSELQQ